MSFAEHKNEISFCSQKNSQFKKFTEKSVEITDIIF